MSYCKWKYVSGIQTVRHAAGKAPTTMAQQTNVVELGNLGALDTADVWPVLGAFGIAIAAGVAVAAIWRP